MNAADLQGIKERAAKARAFTHTIETVPACKGWQFTLQRPSRLGLREDVASGKAENHFAFQRGMVYKALLGWTGPTVGDVDPSAEGELAALPLPFDAEFTELLLEDRMEVLDELANALMAKLKEAHEKQEATAKN